MSRKDRRNAIEFIKGWWAGDGSIIGRKNVIDHLMIRSKEHQLLAKELFEVCGIKTGISKDSVFTCDGILGVKDFIKLGFISLRSK